MEQTVDFSSGTERVRTQALYFWFYASICKKFGLKFTNASKCNRKPANLCPCTLIEFGCNLQAFHFALNSSWMYSQKITEGF